ncbi:MAG: TIM barrel protein [Isosphaeraceae bacterium]
MPVRSSVTVSLVPEARGGPFVYWDDLAAACRSARALGFDAIEIFPRSPESVDPRALRELLDGEGLGLAAMGTGAGWVVHQWTLTHSDPEVRGRARSFIRAIIDRAGPFGAPAIIGSMQGKSGGGVDRATALNHLADALEDLGEHARAHGVPLLHEPLNRYETDLVNTVEQGRTLLARLSTRNVRLLADLFHMNIEEVEIAEALRSGGASIGHLHFVDSNRRAAGFGHLDYRPIAGALSEIGYDGFASAEALPLPDPEGAATRTIRAFREVFSQGPPS